MIYYRKTLSSSGPKLTAVQEDVKDIYIKALGLKGYTKGLSDIQSKEIWFEAKDTGKTSSYAMFTQLSTRVRLSRQSIHS